MRQYQVEPRAYELLTILSPDVADDDLKGQIDAIAGYIATAGGEVTAINRESPWGRRRLAYSIRHAGRDVRDGYYTLFHLRLEPRRVVEIERDIKLNDSIIRHLITHHEPTPSDEAAAPAEGGVQPAAAADPAGRPEAQTTPPVSPPVESLAAAAPVGSALEPVAVAEPEIETSPGVESEPVAVAEVPIESAPDVAAAPDTDAAVEPEPAPSDAETDVPAAVEPAVAPEPVVQELSEETIDSPDEPPTAPAAGAENTTEESRATAPDEEPDNPPAQSAATPKEE